VYLQLGVLNNDLSCGVLAIDITYYIMYYGLTLLPVMRILCNIMIVYEYIGTIILQLMPSVLYWAGVK